MPTLRHLPHFTRGDQAAAQGIVPLMILTAGFVTIAMIVVVWLDRVTENKAADTAACVEMAAMGYSSQEQCGDAHGERTLANEKTYKDRYSSP